MPTISSFHYFRDDESDSCRWVFTDHKDSVEISLEYPCGGVEIKRKSSLLTNFRAAAVDS
ncbi:hypothetical protein Pint_23429 [Pistacia integerrima]|uniref:Uncharacterized protein n=1 Tax=Pistacia integerrima TaxID=434235 RepID=A0ACC0YKT0_9ROSI|nr:hypothetical protein Pint_23429 [Pistacia integerrima]